MFAGGYGGADYNTSIALLCGAVLASPGIRFAFAPHPGYEAAAVERAIFAAHNVTARLPVVTDVSTVSVTRALLGSAYELVAL